MKSLLRIDTKDLLDDAGDHAIYNFYEDGTYVCDHWKNTEEDKWIGYWKVDESYLYYSFNGERWIYWETGRGDALLKLLKEALIEKVLLGAL